MKTILLFIFTISTSVFAQTETTNTKVTVPAISSPKDTNVEKEITQKNKNATSIETKKTTTTKTNSKKIPPKQIEAPKQEETILEKTENAAEQTRLSRENNQFFGYITYSPLDLLIPSKIGATIGYNKTADKTWELEYLKGSAALPWILKDLGKMSDERISIMGRSYMGSNSFNFSYGLTYYNFTIHLGDAYLNRMTYGNYPSVDVLEIQSLGLNIGIGNRWTFAKNLSVGVDWVSWSQPLYTISRKSDFLKYSSNQTDRDDVDKVLRWVANFPRLTLLKLQLGATF